MLLTYGFTQAGDAGWRDGKVDATIGSGTALAGAFLVWLRRAPHPLFPLRIFAPRQFLWGCVMATIASLVMMTTIFIVPQYAQLSTNTDAFGLGLRLLPFIGGLVLAVPVAEELIKRTRLKYRLVVSLGFLMVAAGVALAAQAEITSPTWYLVVWNALIGAGVGFALPSSMDLAMSVMDSAESGTGSGVVQCLRQLGGTFGVAILGTVLVTAYRDRLELDGLPAAALEAVRSSPSLGGVVAQQARMPELLANVQSSFMAGMGYVFYALSGVAPLTSLIAAARVPREPGEHLGSAAGAL